jgi:predicted esterase
LPALALSARADEPAGRLRARPGTPTQAIPSAGYTDLDGAVLYVPKSFSASLVVMLHGSGQSARSIAEELAPQAEQRGFLLLAPPSRGSTWDLQHAPQCADTPLVDAATARVFALAKVERTALAGMSDGASFALSLGLANGDLFSDVMAFSAGYFHVEKIVGRPRIFISHGRRDRVLAFHLGERIATTLAGAGCDVTFRPFDGGHEIPPDGLAMALDRFLN